MEIHVVYSQEDLERFEQETVAMNAHLHEVMDAPGVQADLCTVVRGSVLPILHTLLRISFVPFKDLIRELVMLLEQLCPQN